MINNTLFPEHMLFGSIPIYILDKQLMINTSEELSTLEGFFSEAYQEFAKQEIDVIYVSEEPLIEDGSVEGDIQFPNLTDGALFASAAQKGNGSMLLSIISGIGMTIFNRFENMIVTPEFLSEFENINDGYYSTARQFFLVTFARRHMGLRDSHEERVPHLLSTLEKIDAMVDREVHESYEEA